MAWDQPTTLPPWMNPRETPFDTLLKGVQAGSMISNAWNQRTELGLQAEKQAVTLPLQVEEASLKSQAQRVNLAEQQIGLDAMQQEVQFQKDDLSGFQEYVKSLSMEPDAALRAATPVPAFMSSKYNKQAEAINRNMQDTQAVKEYNDVRKENLLAVVAANNDLIKRATAVQGKLPPGSPPIATPNPKGGLWNIDQSLLNQGEALAAKEKMDLELQKEQGRLDLAKQKQSADAKAGELKPIVSGDGKTIGYYSTNPTTGHVDFKFTGGKDADPESTMQLRSIHKQIDDYEKERAQLMSGKTSSPSSKERVNSLSNLNTMISRLKDERAAVLSARGASAARPAMGGYKIGSTYGGLKYLGGEPNSQSNWESAK